MRLVTLCLALACLGLVAASAPERRVKGNALTSRHEPAVRIEVPKSATYAGADSFVLYEMADCELHAFVEADADKRVRRIWWIQFEKYLDSRPELHHRYDSPRQVKIDGRDFYLDTWLDAEDDKRTPGSDGERIRALIRSKGFIVPPDRMSVRLVHLLDEAKRKELMLIYSEDLAPTGHEPKALREGGAQRDDWAELERALVKRAVTSFELRFSKEDAKP
jgi:hypothetical protein